MNKMATWTKEEIDALQHRLVTIDSEVGSFTLWAQCSKIIEDSHYTSRLFVPGCTSVTINNQEDLRDACLVCVWIDPWAPRGSYVEGDIVRFPYSLLPVELAQSVFVFAKACLIYDLKMRDDRKLEQFWRDQIPSMTMTSSVQTHP